MAKKYRVKETSQLLYPTLVTQIDGATVSLGKTEIKYKKTLAPGAPAIDAVAKVATQAQLKRLFEDGNPHVEEFEDNAPEVASNPK